MKKESVLSILGIISSVGLYSIINKAIQNIILIITYNDKSILYIQNIFFFFLLFILPFILISLLLIKKFNLGKKFNLYYTIVMIVIISSELLLNYLNFKSGYALRIGWNL